METEVFTRFAVLQRGEQHERLGIKDIKLYGRGK